MKSAKYIFLYLQFTFLLLYACTQDKHLVILHLNDSHSRIESFPDNAHYYADEGGMERIYNCVNKIRQQSENVLLFHCGDQVQGTPYFNFFEGETEMEVGNLLGYDAACLGNHEFDNGLQFLASMIKRAKFPIVATNLDFTGTPIENLTKNYLVVKKDGLKIGVIGLTIDFKGLVSKANSEGVKWLDPVASANTAADFLKNKERCDLVIVISHLGYYPDSTDKIGDTQLAAQSRNIDLILGGHTHTFMEKPVTVTNLDGKEVVINQTGAYGIYVGRIDLKMKNHTD
jgi:5'-nucleotidase